MSDPWSLTPYGNFKLKSIPPVLSVKTLLTYVTVSLSTPIAPLLTRSVSLVIHVYESQNLLLGPTVSPTYLYRSLSHSLFLTLSQFRSSESPHTGTLPEPPTKTLGFSLHHTVFN